MNAALNLALRLAVEDRRAARELDAALAQPFAVAALDRRRLLTRVGIADVSRDGALCREALAPLERALPWDRLILEARARCYGTEGQLAGRAARDLARYRAAEPRPLLGGGS
jgi:hypothetical protein